MAGGKHYSSKSKDMSWASMNTEAWHGKGMGLKDWLKARVVTKRANDRENP